MPTLIIANEIGLQSGFPENIIPWCNLFSLIVLTATLIVLIAYTIYTAKMAAATQELAEIGRLPVVSCNIEYNEGELVFVLINRTAAWVDVRIQLEIKLCENIVMLPGVYSGNDVWHLMPNAGEHGAGRLLEWILSKDYPHYAQCTTSMPSNPNAASERDKLLAWEVANKQPAVRFTVALICRTHGTSRDIVTPPKKWFFSFSRGVLVLDV